MNVGVVVGMVLLLARACGAGDTSEDAPDFTADAFGPPSSDMGAGLFDGSAGGDMGPSGRGGLYADPSRASDDLGEMASPEPGVFDGDIASCFDGADSDDDGAADCADPDCAATVRSCCAGRGDCCASPSTVSFFADPSALASCASDPASCLPAAGFGAPGPYVADGLSGGGDGVYDSGLLFDATIDLDAERASLTATFALPADCAGGCMESVSFGFTDQDSFDAQSHVEALLALTLSPSRGEVSLRAGDRVLARFAAAEGEWSVHAAPDGTVGVESPTGSEPVGPRFVPARGAHPVVWGHNANPSATASGGARLRSLALRRALCDMPRAWAPATVVSDGSGPLSIGGRPSIATLDDVDVLAWASDGSIQLAAGSSAAGDWTMVTGVSGGELERFSGPELVPLAPLGGEGLALFMAREGDDPGIVRATGNLGDGFGDAALVLQPSRIGATRLTAPTLAVRNADPALVMVAWAEGANRQLHAFSSGDVGETWEARGALALPELDDVEELGAPSLTVQNGTYLIYLPVRRGTRWRIAQFVSDDLRYWRLVDDRAFTSGSEQHAPLGARDPDARVWGGGVELFYLGVDGVEPTPLRTWRPATDDAILPGS
ncbi:MAG: hypothetical protein JJ863_03415 [Deltaproteobacteria bacterium]|nr:hypothetical protein [Deltaproteobacteria bacterium]